MVAVRSSLAACILFGSPPEVINIIPATTISISAIPPTIPDPQRSIKTVNGCSSPTGMQPIAESISSGPQSPSPNCALTKVGVVRLIKNKLVDKKKKSNDNLFLKLFIKIKCSTN